MDVSTSPSNSETILRDCQSAGVLASTSWTNQANPPPADGQLNEGRGREEKGVGEKERGATIIKSSADYFSIN